MSARTRAVHLAALIVILVLLAWGAEGLGKNGEGLRIAASDEAAAFLRVALEGSGFQVKVAPAHGLPMLLKCGLADVIVYTCAAPSDDEIGLAAGAILVVVNEHLPLWGVSLEALKALLGPPASEARGVSVGIIEHGCRTVRQATIRKLNAEHAVIEAGNLALEVRIYAGVGEDVLRGLFGDVWCARKPGDQCADAIIEDRNGLGLIPLRLFRDGMRALMVLGADYEQHDGVPSEKAIMLGARKAEGGYPLTYVIVMKAMSSVDRGCLDELLAAIAAGSGRLREHGWVLLLSGGRGQV